MGWTIILDSHKGSEESYEEQKWFLYLLRNEMFDVDTPVSTGFTKEINYPDLIELLWDVYTKHDTILLRMEDGSLKPLPHHNENIIDKDGSVGKFLRKEHNIFKIWRAGGFDNL